MQTITPRRYRQLQPEDRVTMASLLQLNQSLRDIATVLKRSPSTISREQRRNSDMNVPAVVHSPYASSTAQSQCRQRRRAGRPLAKLHTDRPMFEVVRRLLGLRWSPEQIALTLAALHPKGHGYRVSTETIYNCIYAQPVGELKRELVACLRQVHNKRVPRSKGQDRRGQIPDMLSIHVRPPEIEDRQFPGHWEGDLIKGEANASAVGTLVVRPRQRDGKAQRVGQSHGYCRVLLRSTQPLAAGLQREHERPCSPVPSQAWLGTAKSSWMRLPMKSTTDPGRAWAYDLLWRSTLSCS